MIIVLAASLQAQWSTDPNNNLIVGYGLNPAICSDSTGGCYITYEFGTSGYPRQLCVERLDKYGYKPWGDKIQIFGELEEQWQAEIIEDGEGGVIISYEDDEFIPPLYYTARIRVQRVDSSGELLWGQTGVRVTTEELNHGVQRLVSDGNGGCVIVWSNELSDFTFDYRANRINNLGERAWSDTGIFLENSIYNDAAGIVKASDGNYYVQIRTNLYRIREGGEIVRRDSVTSGNLVPDPEGGVVLSYKVWTGMIPKLVAQRKDSLGNNLWQEPYVEIADSIASGSFRIGENNRIINFAWLGRYDSKPYFQAINLEGILIYQNKILLSEDPSGTTLIGIVSSYYNNTIFSWSVSGEINSIFAQMYDTLSNKIWSENGIIVSHPRMTYQQYTSDRRGGFIVAGLINNFTVAAQQVSKNGFLGEIISNVNVEDHKLTNPIFSLSQNYPNPFNSSTIIQFRLPKESDINIKLFNVLGENIQTITDGYYSKGEHSINFSSGKLSSGIYLYKLQTGTNSLTKKLIILK